MGKKTSFAICFGIQEWTPTLQRSARQKVQERKREPSAVLTRPWNASQYFVDGSTQHGRGVQNTIKAYKLKASDNLGIGLYITPVRSELQNRNETIALQIDVMLE